MSEYRKIVSSNKDFKKINKDEKIVEMALRMYTAKTSIIKDLCYKKKIRKEEFNEVLKKTRLEDVKSRSEFVYKSELVLENLIYKHINTQDLSFVVREFKKYLEVNYHEKMLNTYDMVKFYIGSRGYNEINDMRAFRAIADGDLETYMLLANNSLDKLAHCIVRVVSFMTGDEELISQVEKLFTRHFDEKVEEGSFSTYSKVARNVCGRNYVVQTGYRKAVEDLDVVFMQGTLEILHKMLVDEESKELYDLIVNYSSTKSEIVDIEDTKESVEEVEVVIDNGNDDIKQVESLVDDSSSLDVVAEVNVEEMLNELTGAECSYLYDAVTTDSEKLVNKLRGCLDGIVDVIKAIEEREESEKYNENVQANDDLVKASDELRLENNELKLENTRLMKELEIQKRKASGSSLKQFVRALGSKDAAYQLSDLYLISENIISEYSDIQGRLMNMFMMLENLSLEPFSSYREIGDEFEIVRKDLAKNFTLDAALEGEDQIVKVKLIKNGWMLDNEVVILPLVKQI